MSKRVAEDFAMAERGVLQRALARAEGNVKAAAEALGMSRATATGSSPLPLNFTLSTVSDLRHLP
jgi:transcriptional regulator with PAS, ATPase and Fis domain